jgi:hypothetical protein
LKAWISDEMDEATRKNIKQRLPWRQGWWIPWNRGI